MINVSDEFKNAMRAPVKTIEAKVHLSGYRAKSINLFNENDWVEGYINDEGNIGYWNQAKTFNEMKASGFVQIVYSKVLGNASMRLAEFDENKKFIKRQILGIVYNHQIISLGADTRYVKASIDWNPEGGLGYERLMICTTKDKNVLWVPYGSKNLFDISKVVDYRKGDQRYILNKGDRLELKLDDTSSNIYGLAPHTLKDYCPDLRVGDTCTLSFETTGIEKYIYLQAKGRVWWAGQTLTIDQTMLESAVGWYASGVNTTGTIKNIQIEYGDKATEYEPYTGSYITSSDYLCSLTLGASGQLFLGTAKSAKAVMLGTEYGNLATSRATIYASVQTDAQTHAYEQICLGNYIIKKQTVNLEKGMTTFEMFDDITSMGDHKYNADDIQFPCTVKTLTEQLAKMHSLNIADDISKLPNMGYTMKENLWATIKDTNYRDILNQIAGATATFISVGDANNTLTLRPAQMTSQETLTYDNIKTIDYGKRYGNINTVTLSRQPQEDNITASDSALAEKDGVVQVKLANNEILDDDRQTLATPILNAVKGFGYWEVKMLTEGHLWYEVGDRLTITDGNNSWDTIVTEIGITIDGAVKELIKCVAPKDVETNYSTTGSIYKTVWNTEIKVDKQGNAITSVVQKQDQVNENIYNQFTKIEQDIDAITSSVQTVGGNNLVKNSVGYATNNDGTLSFWEQTGKVTASTSPESISYGAISGNQINIPKGAKISQKIFVAVDKELPYTLSAYLNKPVVGECVIRIYNDSQTYRATLPDQKGITWKRLRMKNWHPSMSWVIIEVENISCDYFNITDLMVSQSEQGGVWQQANGEIINTQVSLTEDGVKVQSSIYAGDFVEITPLEFAGYSSASGSQEKVFSLNRDVTKVSKISAQKQIFMNPIKVIPSSTGNRQGWAFVKSEED